MIDRRLASNLAVVLAVLLTWAWFAPRLFAEDWSVWRGPRGDGTSNEKDLPLKWSDKENVTWRAAIPGKGHSSPVVHGDRIYVLTPTGPRSRS